MSGAASSEMPKGKACRPGESAPATGVYEVTHGNPHRPPHEVIAIAGDELPACRTYNREVSFRLIRQTDHITQDWDFAGPTELTLIKE